MIDINIDTKFIYLLGDPLRQSYAQNIQNFMNEKYGVNQFYLRCEVGNDHIGDILNGVKYMNCRGLAVTKPNKVFVMQYLDEIDVSARLIGACNTIKIEDGKLIGYNTDGIGFTNAISKKTSLKGASILCFGAGGAGRACMIQSAICGAGHIAISDPDREAALKVVETINEINQGTAVYVEAGQALENEIKNADVIANMSGLGMGKHIGVSPLVGELMQSKKSTVYFDAIYNPEATKFLELAAEQGYETMNGLDMMLEQGMYQFSIWTGIEADGNELREFAVKMLKK